MGRERLKKRVYAAELTTDSPNQRFCVGIGGSQLLMTEKKRRLRGLPHAIRMPPGKKRKKSPGRRLQRKQIARVFPAVSMNHVKGKLRECLFYS